MDAAQLKQLEAQMESFRKQAAALEEEKKKLQQQLEAERQQQMKSKCLRSYLEKVV